MSIRRRIDRRRSPIRLVEGLEPRRLMCNVHWADDGTVAMSAVLSSDTDATANVVPSFVRRINFQPDGSNPVPDFYRVDTGAPYGLRSNGLTYGWSADNRDGRDRNALPDQRYDTFHHMQRAGANFTWNIAVPNGTYTVRVVAGDPSFFDSVYRINIEGQLAASGTPTSGNRFVEGTRTVTVSDGRLTISNGSGAVNNKLAFVEIVGGSTALPVVSVSATDGSASETPGNTGTFTLTRTGSTAAALTVGYTVGGSASPGADYATLPGTVTFAAGSATATVTVNPVDDAAVESSETVTLAIRPDMAYSHAFRSSGTVTIADNDGNTGSTQITWNRASSPGAVSSEAQSAVLPDRWLLIGGFNGSFVPQAHVWMFKDGTWTRRNDGPRAITHAGTAVDGNTVWLAGGYLGKPTGGQIFATAEVWKYDGINDTWTAGPALPQQRGGGALIRVGRSIYFFGGQDITRTKETPDMWALNLDNTSAGWQRMASMPRARNHTTAVEFGGKIYVLGGQTGVDGGLTAYADIQIYDPSSNTWTVSGKALPAVRSHTNHATFVHGGSIYMVGGEFAHGRTVNSVWRIDPATLNTTSLTSFPDSRMSAAATILNGELYVVGGFGGGLKTQAWRGVFA